MKRMLFPSPGGQMLGCSHPLKDIHGSNVITRRQNGRRRLSKVARDFCRSTEDLCKSTNAYKMWDQRQMIRHWRHAAWALLGDHYVVSAIWLDDVLAFHGSDISLRNYHLVVHNVEVAAGILALYGYRPHGWMNDYSILSELHCQRVKMSAPGAKVDVVLLSATEWCYDLSPDALHDDLCPYLPEFVGAMIELWLRVPIRSYNVNATLMDFLATVIHECYRLVDFGDEVCEDDYAIWLRPQHREVHFDIVARSKGFVKDNLDFNLRHKYHVHKANLIRLGKFDPRPRRRKGFEPQLPSLMETPEDTKPVMKDVNMQRGGSFFMSTTSVDILPAYMEIGIAL